MAQTQTPNASRVLQQRPRRAKGADEISGRMRTHLQEAADKAKLQISEVARRADLPPTSLYNFLKGDSAQLSNPTIWALANVLPGLDLNLMLNVPDGMPRLVMPQPASFHYDDAQLEADIAADLARVPERDPLEPAYAVDMVELRMEACAGVFRRLSLLDAPDRSLIGMPRVAAKDGRMFGVRVKAPGAEQLYADGTLLGCTTIKTGPAFARRIAQLQPGRRVIVLRTPAGSGYGRNSETTVREIVGKGPQRSLVLRSRKGEPVAIPLPPDFTGAAWEHEGHQVRIVGLVEVSCRIEGAAGP